MNLLLVEDEARVADFIQRGLRAEGYSVTVARDGETAVGLLDAHAFDIVVLDLMLPGISGQAVCQRMRSVNDTTPVLMLTALDAVDDRVAGLRLGADDYLVKPFDLGELAARLRAISRRRGGRAAPLLCHGDLVFDPASRSVSIGDELIPLPAKALAILEALLERPGMPLSRERLEQILYGWDEGVESNAVEVHIHHLRKKLGKDRIRTIRGLGYMIPKA